MSVSVDCSEIMARILQQCSLEDRQPTGEEYELIISYLQQVNVQLQQGIIQVQQEKNELEINCTRSSHDREIALGILHTEHLEVEKHKQLAKQLETGLQELQLTAKGLKEELSEATANLKDTLETNDALTIENDKLRQQQSAVLNVALSSKKALEEINTKLLKEQEEWDHKKNEYDETIAALNRHFELCQCKTVRIQNSVQESLKKKATISSEYVQCLHVSDDYLTMTNISQRISSKINSCCKVCDSAEDVNICVSCGARRCNVHLYDAHDSTHTVYINMTVREVWCHSCDCVLLTISNNLKQHDQNISKIRKRKSNSPEKKFVVPTSPPSSLNYRKKNLKLKSTDQNSTSKFKHKSRSQSLSQLPNETAVTTTSQHLMSQLNLLTDSHSTTATNTHPPVLDSPTTNSVSVTKTYLDAHPFVITTTTSSLLHSSSLASVVTIPTNASLTLTFSSNTQSSVTTSSKLPGKYLPSTSSTLPTNRVGSPLPANPSMPSTVVHGGNKLHKKPSDKNEYAHCTHVSGDQLNTAKISQWVTSKITPLCKKLIGDKKTCNSTENVSICVHCGVSRCDTHLHDVHDSTHYVYINMTTKEICCYSCNRTLSISGSIQQYDQTVTDNRNKKYNSYEDDGSNNRYSPVLNATPTSVSFTTSPFPSHAKVVTVTTNTLPLSSSSSTQSVTTVSSSKDLKLLGKNFTNSLLPDQPPYSKKSTKDTTAPFYESTPSLHRKTLSLPSCTNSNTYSTAPFQRRTSSSDISTTPTRFENSPYLFSSTVYGTHRQASSWDGNFVISKQPFKGLVNDGCTCFSNAAIQCLSRINQFADLQAHLFKPGDCVKVELKKLNMSIDVTIPAEIVDHERVSEHLNRTIAKIRTPPKHSYETDFNPCDLLGVIRKKYTNNFRPYRQGDAHELMRCILDAVRMEEFEKVKRGIQMKFTGSENGDVETLLNGEDKMLCKAALRGAHKIRTYIDQVIGGELLSVVVCDNCKHRAELIEPFLDISLPIPEKLSYSMSSYRTSHDSTLKQCLKEYTSKDVLDSDNKFICSNCSGNDMSQLRRAVKQLKIQTLPEVFIMHLKRFSIDHIITKNSTHIRYPLEIDVGPYCTKRSLTDKTHYSLFAVVQHIGSLNSGHYIAYIKTPEGQWYKADDSLVTKIEESEALNQEAYLLFYEQIHLHM